MRLKRLELWNFKGIKHFKMEPDGKNISVFGENATGKTTLTDALSWLLNDQDSIGASLLPKPLDQTGEAAHGVSSDVEAIFLDDNGGEFTLKKSFFEKWTKRHGSAKKVFTGHTTKYSIDGVPDILEKEYKKRLAEIAPESVFKLLTNVRYFSETLHWQDRRQILLDICGDISDTDIIASDKKLSRMPEILNGKTLEGQKKIITARKTKLNKELSELPVRIDEVSKGQPDITGLDLPTIEKALSELSKALTEKNEEAARIESGGEIAEKIKKQRGIESRLLEIENSANESRNKAESAQRKKALEAETVQRKKISDLESAKEDEESARDKTLKAIKNRKAVNKAAEQEIIKLRVEWNTANDKVFNETDTICFNCGQDYPEDRTEQIREKFHTNKAERLKSINEEGRGLGDEITERNNQNKTDQANISFYEKKIEEITGQIDKIKSQDPEPEKEGKPVEKNKEQEALELDLTELKLNINGLRANSHEEVEKVKAEIDAITEKQKAENLKKQTLESYAKDQKRIKELGCQQKTCAVEYENLEDQMFIMDEFIKAKCKMLEKNVNSLFSMAEFKLFNVLVNGQVEDCCIVTYQGIDYNAGLNNSSRINVGLDIINTLSKFYKLQLPVFIDNSESITELIPTGSQIIRLVVSKDYPKLTVKLIVSETVQCAECDWVGRHSETNKETHKESTFETCPKCGGAIKEYKGLVVRES